MIVFTIYKNGGNTCVLGASFSCAVFGARGSSGVNLGARYFGRALCSAGILSKRRQVYPIAFRPSARSKCSGARSVYSGADSVCS